MSDLPKTRDAAYASGSKFYFTGRACKAGHINKRYTSGGNCVDCIVGAKEIQRVKNRIRDRVRIAHASKDTSSYTLSIRPEWFEAFEHLKDIMNGANVEQTERTWSMLESMKKESKNPFISATDPIRATLAVNKHVILKTVVYKDGRVTNLPMLDIREQTETSPALIKLNGQLYEGTLIMDCLRGTRELVHPFNASQWLYDNPPH
jgi:hypothetical protein